jgi:hypothetical protein
MATFAHAARTSAWCAVSALRLPSSGEFFVVALAKLGCGRIARTLLFVCYPGVADTARNRRIANITRHHRLGSVVRGSMDCRVRPGNDERTTSLQRKDLAAAVFVR